MAQPQSCSHRGTTPSSLIVSYRPDRWRRACGWRLLAVLLTLCVAGAPKRAGAEAQPLTKFHGGGMYLTTQSPTVARDGKIIDCSMSTEDCYPLNRAACNDPNGLAIRFSLGKPLSSQPPSYLGGTQSLYAFLSDTPSCIYSTNSAQIAANGNLIGTTTGLPSSSVFFGGGFTTFSFPTDLAAVEPNTLTDATNKTFTTRDLLRLMNVCPDTGGTEVNLTPVYICVGVDSTGNKGGINNATSATAASSSSTSSTNSQSSSSGDLFGYLALQVDTHPPATPMEMTVVPKNGRASVRVRYDASLLDVYTLRVRYTDDADDLSASQAADANGTLRGCGAWTHAKTAQVDVKGVGDGNKSFSVDGLTNGTPYAFCAVTSDFLQNDSDPTTIQSATPRHECDLFSCYDGSLRVGFCASEDLPALWLVSAAACAWVAWRRRRRQGALWLVLAAMALPWPARAESPVWLKSEPPVSVEKARPEGNVGGAPEFETDRRKQHVAFSRSLTSEELDFSPKRAASPSWSLEVDTGPYKPQIGNRDMRALYDLVYAQRRRGFFPSRPLRTRISGAWFPFRGFASGPYAAVGFWVASGPSRICGTEEAPATCTAATVMQSRKGNDTADLFLVPVSIGWQHTHDLLPYLRFPLGVGGRIGLMGNVWWATNGGHASRYRGRRAQGMTVTPELSAHVTLNVSQLAKAGRDSRIHGLLVAEYTYVPPGALFGSDRSHRLGFGAPWIATLGIRAHFLR